MILLKCYWSFLLATIVTQSSAGPTSVPVVDAVTKSPISRTTNILSYPAALSGAPGLGFPTPFRVVGHYKELFVNPNTKSLNNQQPPEIESKMESHQNDASESRLHIKYVTPTEVKTDTRPHRDVQHYVATPGAAGKQEYIIPEHNEEVPAQSFRLQPHENVESQEYEDYSSESGLTAHQNVHVPPQNVAYNKPPVQHSYKEPVYASQESKEDEKNAKYEFMYRVEDHGHHHGGNGRSGEITVSDFGHSEARDGGKTWGRYFVKLPDGRVQTVRYWADHSGYHAEVKFQGKAHHPEPRRYHNIPKIHSIAANTGTQPRYSSHEIKQLLPSYEALNSDEQSDESSQNTSEES